MKENKKIIKKKYYYLKNFEIKKIQKLRKHYPTSQSAIIEALKIVQKNRSWISDCAIKDISTVLKISSSEIESLATFYNQIFRKPVGKNIIRICDSFVCFILGYKKIKKRIIKHLQIRYGKTTKDKKYTFLPTCCLGACDKGPVIMINEKMYFKVKSNYVPKILDKYK